MIPTHTSRARALALALAMLPLLTLLVAQALGAPDLWALFAALLPAVALLAALLFTLGAAERSATQALDAIAAQTDPDTGWDDFDKALTALHAQRRDQQRQTALLRDVLNKAPLAIVLCDTDDRVVLSNSTARDLFTQGSSLTGEVFTDVLDRCSPDMRSAVLNQGNVLFTVDAGDDGDAQAYHVSRPHFDVDLQRHTLYLVTQLTRELNRQEVAIWKKVIRVINHEFNNSLAPISSLLTSARMILERPDDHARLHKVFDLIEDRTRHLQSFLLAYAQFARLGPPQRRDVPWSELMEEVHDLTGCHIEALSQDATGHIDPAQLQQALINVIKNATDAGSPPDQTTLSIQPRPDGGARLTVRDRGSGMTDEIMRQALMPFYSTKKTGTGLGLALVREIMDGHGGRVELAHREGGGVEVHLILPGS